MRYSTGPIKFGIVTVLFLRLEFAQSAGADAQAGVPLQLKDGRPKDEVLVTDNDDEKSRVEPDHRIQERCCSLGCNRRIRDTRIACSKHVRYIGQRVADWLEPLFRLWRETRKVPGPVPSGDGRARISGFPAPVQPRSWAHVLDP